MPNDFDRMNIQRANVFGKERSGLDKLMGSMTGQNAPEPQKEIVEVEKVVEVVPEGAIVRRDDGAMVYGRFVMTDVALEIPEGCQKLELEDVGGILRNIDGALTWWIGDWADYANKVLKMTYGQIADYLGGRWTAETIQYYASICRGVHGLVRNKAVSISHCSKISNLEEPMQRAWLFYAEQRPALRVAELGEDIRLLKVLIPARQREWLEWASFNPDIRFADVPELQPSKPVIPALPAHITEGREETQKRLGKLAAFVQGKKKLTPDQIQQEGRAIIEWVQQLMEASE